MAASDRSVSRGRDTFQSTGRGGLGNIRQASLSRDARPESGPDDFSQTRGREPVVNPTQLFSTGRGGAGNIRSPSRDPNRPPALDPTEKAVINEYIVTHEGAPHSTGRGGVGNINRSRSRDASRDASNRHVFSTGRGGAGNIIPGEGVIAESIDEDERRKVSLSHDHDGIHSTGRGGSANITHTVAPAVERIIHETPQYESHGRGGSGNISRDRSRGRT